MNFRPNAELINGIKTSSGLLIAKSKAIPCYKLFAKIGLVPDYEDVIDASRHLNLIASILEDNSHTHSLTPSGSNIMSSLKVVGCKLNIIVKY